MTFDYQPCLSWTRDDWAVADQAGFGPNFSMHSGSVGRVTSGHPNARVLGNGAGTIADWGTFKYPANSDDMATRFTLVNPTPQALATDREFVLCHRGNPELTTAYGVWFVMLGTNAYIYTMVNSTQTSRATAAAGSNLIGVPLLFSSVGNLHSVVRTDTGATVVGWNDSGGAAARGSGYRHLKMAITSWFPVFQQQYTSPVPDFLDFTAA